MFTTLVESRARRARDGKTTTLSLVIHGAIVGLVVALTATTDSTAAPIVREPTVIFIPAPAPPQRTNPHTIQPASPVPHMPFHQIDIPQIDMQIPRGPEIIIDLSKPVNAASAFIGHGVKDPGVPVGPGTRGGLPGVGGIMDAALADRPPHVLGNTPAPRYPNILRETGTAGHVTARFVVDTLGRVEFGSVAITETSHALFAEAVRAALPSYRFSPGESEGRTVRTLVQMPFTFAIR